MGASRWIGLWTCCGLLVGCAQSPMPFDGAKRVASPSLVSAPTTLDVARFAKTDDCATCHTDIASQWMHSAHAYASFDNPWYRASVDEFRKHRGPRASRFCAGCHDPLLLASGDIDGDVTPDNPLAYAGITCLVCHSIESATADGNASYTLSDRSVPIPDPAVPEEIEAHRSRLAMPVLRSGAMCGSCHRSFSGPAIGNTNHLPGIDDLGDWRTSAFGAGVPDHRVVVSPATCQDCHMRATDAELGDLAALEGRVRGHRWAAAHTARAAQLPDDRARTETEHALTTSLVLDVGGVRIGERRAVFPREAWIRSGDRLVFDIVLENVRVGHRFPGGVRDLHDAWVEVEVRDATGELLGASRPSGDDDEGVFALRATVLDASANPELLHRVHRFATSAFDRTLQPHQAQVVRYEITVPPRPRLPLRVDARVWHRKHTLAFQREACEAHLTERGQAFAAGTTASGKVALDPCMAEPRLEIARATAWVGRGARRRARHGGAARPDLDRLLTQGRALLEDTQEHLGAARGPLERALRIAELEGSDTAAAQAELLIGRLEAAQGRTTAAVAAIRRAKARLGPDPVFDRALGDAYARVWRWRRAIEAYQQVVEAAPRDFTAWRRLAQAHGSLGNDRAALEASETGLLWAPHDEDLLRSRALALRALGHPGAAVAEERWLQHRTPDEASHRRTACERKRPRCRTDRQPIPRYRLVPPRAKDDSRKRQSSLG